MNRKNYLKEVEINRIYENSGLNLINNANLIVVDVQPAYENGFNFDMFEFTQFLNESNSNLSSLTFLFNGPDLGFPDEHELKYWFEENGLDQDISYSADWYDKGYAFFRFCMDSGIDEDDIADLVKYMIKTGINDSRDLEKINWNEFMQMYDHSKEEIRELLEFSDDVLYIPDLMDYLKRFSGNIVMCGGGMYECLREVEIGFKALDKDYRLLTKYVY